MSWIILSLVLTGVTPTAAEPQPDLPPSSIAPAQRGEELGQTVRDALRRWARASDKEAAAAAREYLALYNDLMLDDSLPRGERDQLKQKLRSRLNSLLPQIAKRAAIDKRLAEKDKDRPAGANTALVAQPALAQFGGMGGGGAGFGQPGGMAGGGMGGWGARQPEDNGQQLVDLIQRTISPATWSINGGPGAIYYWQPGRSLVISATDDVHGQLGDVLGQLRRAGN